MRLRPWADRRAFFVVHVATDVATLRARVAADTGWKSAGLCACVIGASGTGRLRGLLGVVYLARPLDVGVVAHELAHAAFRAMERRGRRVEHWAHVARGAGSVTSAGEEQFCDIMERLHGQFWDRVRALRLAGPQAGTEGEAA